MIGDLLRANRLRAVLRRELAAFLEAAGHPPVEQEEDGHGVRTLLVGRDPVRILLFGSGALVGYGVPTRVEAVDGPLAVLVAEATGRGVVVEARVRPHVTVDGAVASLGAAGIDSYHVAVWAPDFLEGFDRGRGASWRAATDRMVRRLRTVSSTPLLIALVAPPAGTRLSILPWARRVDRALREVAAQHPNVTAVEIAAGSDAPIGESETYAGYAARLAPAVLAVLARSA